jgi:hypothetical protein
MEVGRRKKEEALIAMVSAIKNVLTVLAVAIYSNPKSFVNFLPPSKRVPGGLRWAEKFTTPARIAIIQVFCRKKSRCLPAHFCI